VEKNLIGLASDHAGFRTKEIIKEYLISKSYQVIDFGASSEESVDYPDYGHLIANAIENGDFERGITVCGSGNGINMAANKHQGIRSAICWNVEIAVLATMHNKANICALPGRFITDKEAIEIVDAFLNSSFEGGRHQRRIDKIPIQ